MRLLCLVKAAAPYCCMAISDPWQPLSIEEVATVLDGLPVRWWIAGGHAIDLFVGSSTRHHQDVDVAVLRPDQLTVQAHLDGWDLRIAHDGRLTRWPPRQLLGPHEYGIWARPNPASAWQFELLVDDVIDGQWAYRRNPAVRLPLEQLGQTTATGLPYLHPEVVLLYKAKQPRGPDEHDAAVAIPRLSGSERAWLATAIAKDSPEHHWLPLLAGKQHDGGHARDSR
jgi:aminoglycoside-2''-adenylyltransferase